jgi:extradiol dioxygenase family protein
MKIDRIHHYNLRCAPSDLEPIEKFYGEVIGLRKGRRPDFPNPGIWLYLDDHPILHVSARCVEGFLRQDHHGSVDHIAFQSKGAGEFMAKLEHMNIPHERQNVPEAGFQIFLRDPVGTLLEFNFPQHEAPAAVGAGTLAPRQTAIAR